MHPAVTMQIDLGLSGLPHEIFIGIHLVLLIVVGLFAYRAYTAGATTFAAGFGLFVLAEVSYIGYHVGSTTFLLSHTVSEVLVFLAFLLVFLGLRDADVFTG